MCWNESVSWATFIVGTILNIIVICLIPNPYIIALAVAWEAVVIIQLFEALAWRNKNTFATYGVYITTLLQPIIVILALLVVSDASYFIKTITVLLLIMYMIWAIYVTTITPIGVLSTSDTCNHLEFSWWLEFPFGPVPYLLTIIIGLLLLMRPIDLSLFIIILLAVTFGISAIFYSCSVGSLWCWFSACLMPIIAIYYYFMYMKK